VLIDFTAGEPASWRRPSDTWLRAVEDDLKSLNFRLVAAFKNKTNRHVWRTVVDTALSRHQSMCSEEQMPNQGNFTDH